VLFPEVVVFLVVVPLPFPALFELCTNSIMTFPPDQVNDVDSEKLTHPVAVGINVVGP
jgi:hypothetical protein